MDSVPVLWKVSVRTARISVKKSIKWFWKKELATSLCESISFVTTPKIDVRIYID